MFVDQNESAWKLIDRPFINIRLHYRPLPQNSRLPKSFLSVSTLYVTSEETQWLKNFGFCGAIVFIFSMLS